MLSVDFVTLFPDLVLPACRHSILGRAEASGLARFRAANPRDFADDRHRTVDDSPYGGGPGMVMKPDVVAAAIRSLEPGPDAAIVLCEPCGRRFEQRDARELSEKSQVVLLCGHYEGIDDRIRQLFATHVFSIGDYVLTGGELPALVIADAAVRLLPGALGSASSLEIDSHASGLLSAPQYTRPEVFEGLAVPDVLKGGDHASADKWKRRRALEVTRANRPDLFCRAKLEKADLDMLSS
jgi:tRNA (guanine37-N1)-methyltransferase